MRILIVEDDEIVAQSLTIALNEQTTNQAKDTLEPLPLKVLTVPLSDRPPSEAKVLILDDDAIVIQEIIQMLNPWGFEVVALPLSVELLLALQIHQSNLLILEVFGCGHRRLSARRQFTTYLRSSQTIISRIHKKTTEFCNGV